MNRALTQIAIAGLCVALIPSPHAFAKQKKKTDLTANPLANVNSKQPDKVLFDKAMIALKKGRYDVARLDLQTLLNTYPETEYAMRAKLAIGDTWYKEGGSAALTQAESEYKDFITFFPNTPEAAEAQMKVGDIYFEQMEKPDRDPANVNHAQEEYRTMLQDFPDSPLVPRAKQRLREVQEVLAQRQFEIGMFYASREEWAGAIARLQTVADTYPLFSHSDQTLIALGDAYATEANAFSRVSQLSPQARAELVKAYNDQAAAAWQRVVTRYPMAPHVEDAKDRLIAMGREVPEPTQQQLAQSEAEEGSRINVKVKDRAMMLVKHGPSTIQAARVGEPTLTDPPATFAPAVNKQSVAMFNAARNNKPLPGLNPTTPEQAAAASTAAAPAAQNQAPAATLQLESVPDQGATNGVSATQVQPGSTVQPTAGSTVTVEVPNGGSEPPSSNGTGSATGTEVNPAPAAGTNPTPVVGGPGPLATGVTDANGAYTGAPPAGTGAATNAKPVVDGVGPPVNKPLPPIDKPAAAPNQINDVTHAPQVNTATAPNKKPKNAPYNSKEESSSKHKKKKGLDKLNPF